MVDGVNTQEVLTQHIAEQFASMDEADAQAKATHEANAAKIQNSLGEALTAALVAKRKPQVVIPPELQEMVIGLSQQPVLIPPMLAYFQLLRQRINEAVSNVLEEMGGERIDSEPTTE